jgi:hypothetical protein
MTACKRCGLPAISSAVELRCAGSGAGCLFESLREADKRLASQILLCFLVKEYVIRKLRKIRFRVRRDTQTGGEVALTRQQVLLAVLAAQQGRPYTPVQIQKAVFLVTKNLPQLVNDGPNFAFEPYDYGPFDQSVYTECELLARKGQAEIMSQDGVRWNRYAASDAGIERGTKVLKSMSQRASDYVKNVSAWVRSQSFEGLVKAIYAQYPEMRANSVFRG